MHVQIIADVFYFSDQFHRQIKGLKDQISDLSKTNYELEREVRLFDQRIGLLINYKKVVEVN